MGQDDQDVGVWLHDDSFGWRARIGVINPSAAVTFDHEWARLLPRGVSFHVTRLRLTEGSAGALAEMASHAAEAASILATSHVHIICYACTIGSVFRSVDGERALTTEIERATGIPAVSMGRAAVEALRALSVKRVAVANPYQEEPNRWIRAFLEAFGIEVVAIRGMAIADSWSIAQEPPSSALNLGLQAFEEARNADGLFLSCGNLRTIEVLNQLERETGYPVVSSNQAMLWYALKTLGLRLPVKGYGRLLEQQP